MGKHEVAAKSFFITVRPTQGVQPDSELEKALIKWTAKQAYGFIVAEKEGWKRHLHIQVWNDKPRKVADVKRQPQRICTKHIVDWNAQQKKHCVNVKHACSNVWETYLINNPEKDDEPTEILYDSKPEKEEGYYPTAEELAKMKELKEQRQVTKGAVDMRMKALSDHYTVFCKEKDYKLRPCYLKSAEFLAWAMYEKKVICTMRDDRTCRWTAKKLTQYLKGSSRPHFLSQDDLDKWKEAKDYWKN